MLSLLWKALPTRASGERTGSKREAYKSQKENGPWIGLHNEGWIQLIRSGEAEIPAITECLVSVRVPKERMTPR